MSNSTTNGNPSTARELIDAVRQTVEKLEAEIAQQKLELEAIRTERDEFRSVIYDSLKRQFGDPKLWDDFDEKDYTLTIDDLIATIREH